ncbi:hypothetical protein WSK_0933 [Novosphingobium sp. Rr 2-17]|uniref:hypothetical protein n=1 Tax=Novosphingobium sp. Rr 2-17 TaxID=555793 RepID=UPI00026991A7|nr:hypothetical protein [Novosphingobium sp. Rr 2-17]EIZ80375.1 hypothetical protein WSK_0933 [Novosphingobium sp. Rr 2-17]
MIALGWPCPLPLGGVTQEYALAFDRARERRLLIVPALFDEGNKLRRFTVEVMRLLDGMGIDSLLPDLPGCNESVQPLAQQSVATWHEAMHAAAQHFGATHVLGIRGGCLFTPNSLPTWHYAPVKAAAILRQMLRARTLASREAGREESRETLEEAARKDGIELIGYPLAAQFYRAFETTVPAPDAHPIAQDDVGGPGLWLRAEPDENAKQAEALATLIAAKALA